MSKKQPWVVDRETLLLQRVHPDKEFQDYSFKNLHSYDSLILWHSFCVKKILWHSFICEIHKTPRESAIWGWSAIWFRPTSPNHQPTSMGLSNLCMFKPNLTSPRRRSIESRLKVSSNTVRDEAPHPHGTSMTRLEQIPQQALNRDYLLTSQQGESVRRSVVATDSAQL